MDQIGKIKLKEGPRDQKYKLANYEGAVEFNLDKSLD